MNPLLIRKKMILEELKKIKCKQFSIEINGELTPICIIDWEELVNEHQQIVDKNSDKTNEELDQFWAHQSTKMMEVYDYFLYDEIMEMKVDNNELLPIGLLGLDAKAHNSGFAEVNNNGFVGIDLTLGKLENAPIYFIEEYTMEKIAVNFGEFKKLLMRE